MARQLQVEYLLWLAAQAHASGMQIALKNSLDVLPSVVGTFDFAITESCYK